MNKDEANRTVLSEYNRPWLFYGISIIIPWALWFTAGYLSYHVKSTVLPQSIDVLYTGLTDQTRFLVAREVAKSNCGLL